MSTIPFSTLALPEQMIANLNTLGFTSMTQIQSESLPPILLKKDVIAQAKTGSGKTLAFGIGLLLALNIQQCKIGALVLCPTRELAEQVSIALRKLARYIGNVKILTLCGGVALGPQIKSLSHGAHIIVGTPGRISDHIRKKTIDFTHVNTLVLDEADRMLDMGFVDEITNIAKMTPTSRQTLLFSATYPNGIAKVSQRIQTNPLFVKADTVHQPNQIQQIFVETKGRNKKESLIKVLGHYQIQSAVIFCQTKIQCDDLTTQLFDIGFFVEALHGDLEQRDRNEVLTLFSNESISLLVATDVAARGLDIKGLQAVINFDLSSDPEVHVHRIGRTGRVDKKGLAISLLTPNDTVRARNITSYMQQTIESIAIDEISEATPPVKPKNSTMKIEGGKKDKMRAGDVLGALTSQEIIPASAVGNINIYPYYTFVAVKRGLIKEAYEVLSNNPIKNRRCKVKIIR
jgi:ATP-independent RNA helicase DbpA